VSASCQYGLRFSLASGLCTEPAGRFFVLEDGSPFAICEACYSSTLWLGSLQIELTPDEYAELVSVQEVMRS